MVVVGSDGFPETQNELGISVFLPGIYPDISGYLIWADKMSGYLPGKIWNFSGFFVQNSSEIRFKTFTNCLLEA